MQVWCSISSLFEQCNGDTVLVFCLKKCNGDAVQVVCLKNARMMQYK